MKVEEIDHIGIAVRDLSTALKLYTDVLNLEVKKIEEFEDLKVKIAFIPVGEVMIELVHPTTSDAPLAKRVREQGEEMYHLALRVKNIDEAFREMKEMGIWMRENESRPGGMGSRVAFTKPTSTSNVIIELVERTEDI